MGGHTHGFGGCQGWRQGTVPLTFYCLGNGNEISCAFILGGQDDALCAVCGEPVGEENGDQEELVRVLTGVWEKSE